VAGGALYTGLHLSVFLSFAFDAQAEDNRRGEDEQEGHLRHYQKLARFNLKQVTRSSSNLTFMSTTQVSVKRHRGEYRCPQEFDVCITVSRNLEYAISAWTCGQTVA
jgi:hypothetical protein